MTNPAASARIRQAVVEATARIPAGFVTTHSDVAKHLNVQPRQVAHILATLDEPTRQTAPWWRVVADGGAIGRHKLRAEQVARLMLDGVPLSAAAVVQEFRDRRVPDLSKPPEKRVAPPDLANGQPPSRSRGMKTSPLPSADLEP